MNKLDINKLDLQWRFESELFQLEHRTGNYFDPENYKIRDEFYRHLDSDNALEALKCYRKMSHILEQL